MLNRLMSSAKRTTLNLGRCVFFTITGLMMLALTCQSQVALGAESSSALETDPQGWVVAPLMRAWAGGR